MSTPVVIQHAPQWPTELSGGALAIAQRLDTPASIATANGDRSALQVDANGSLRCAVADHALTSVTPGTAATNLGKASSGIADPSADVGVSMLAVRKDAATTLVDASGDYSPLQVTQTGHLRVEAYVAEARTSTAIAADSWGKDVGYGELSMDGFRSLSFMVVLSSATASPASYLTVEASDDAGTTWFPLEDVGCYSVSDDSGGVQFVCRGQVSNAPHAHVRLVNRNVAQTTLSPLMITRHN
jgi:hypothetical protein